MKRFFNRHWKQRGGDGSTPNPNTSSSRIKSFLGLRNGARAEREGASDSTNSRRASTTSVFQRVRSRSRRPSRPMADVPEMPVLQLPVAPDPAVDPAGYLRSIYAVREQSMVVMEKAKKNELKHFKVNMDKTSEIARYVSQIIKRDYDDLSKIPPHGRWQHFEVGGVGRIEQLLDGWTDCDAHEKTRRLLDLFLVSVLLDAGAGSRWKYNVEGEGKAYNRSEGLAVASLDMFKAGLFSSDPAQPHRVDAVALERLSAEDVGKAMQVSRANPMDGLEGRTGVLIRLGSALSANKLFFGESARPGNMIDYMLSHETTRTTTTGKPIMALPVFWNLLMDGLTPIWPASRIKLDGQILGDAWPLQVLGFREGDQSTPEWHSIMPFHKLTQWLCYSLMVPMTRLLKVHFAGSEMLTGLAEYRNGGLLIDLGFLQLDLTDAKRGLIMWDHNAQIDGQPQEEVVPCFEPFDDVVVEWRAVTVGMLDILLVEVNGLLGLTGEEGKQPLTLAQMLEAGTWKLGREQASIQRPNTRGPPIMILSDGTVF